MDPRRIGIGTVAGLVAGTVFGMLMHMTGMIQMVGALVGQESAAAGWPVHLVISAVIGAGYGATLGQADQTWARGAGLGVGYGAVWWVLGPLLIMPAWLGMPMLQVDQPQLMSLMGHLAYGLVTGLLFTAGVRQTRTQAVPTQ